MPPDKNQTIARLLESLTEKVTDYGYNDEYGYYNDWADGVRPILSQALSKTYEEGQRSGILEAKVVVPDGIPEKLEFHDEITWTKKNRGTDSRIFNEGYDACREATLAAIDALLDKSEE